MFLKIHRIALALLVGLALFGMGLAQTPQQRVEAVTTTRLLGNTDANFGGGLILCQSPCVNHAGAVEFFTPGAPNYTVNQVVVRFFANAPGYTASVSLWSDSGGLPGALISPIGTVTLSAAGNFDVVFAVNLVLTPSTTYYLYVESYSSVFGGWGFAHPANVYGVLTRGSYLRLSGTWVYDNTLGFAYELSYTVPDALASNAACNGTNLRINLSDGDGPYAISGTGPGLPTTRAAEGTVNLTGPGVWSNVTVTETGGDGETLNLGVFDCSTGVGASAECSGDNLFLTITAGDGPFNITGTGPGLPLNGVGLGTITLLGPAVWSNITVTETIGNLQSVTLTSVGCKNYGIPVPNLGLVMITGEQFQPAYYTPNGAVARGSDGAEIWLPADADGNWYDTYVVADVQEIDGEIWLGLFVGNVNWAYVRLADVTVIVPIQGVE